MVNKIIVTEVALELCGKCCNPFGCFSTLGKTAMAEFLKQ